MQMQMQNASSIKHEASIINGAKILGSAKNFEFGQKFWVREKTLGCGENFGLGRKFWVRGRKFWVRTKIISFGENFGLGRKV